MILTTAIAHTLYIQYREYLKIKCSYKSIYLSGIIRQLKLFQLTLSAGSYRAFSKIWKY